MSHEAVGAEVLRGWVVLVIDGRGSANPLTVCDDCLDDGLVVHKRRAIPGTCEVCGVETV